MSERLDTINEFMLTQFKLQGWEDTTQNRVDLLQGLYDAWKEAPVEPGEDVLEKSLYQITLSGEIFRLRMLQLRSFPT